MYQLTSKPLNEVKLLLLCKKAEFVRLRCHNFFIKFVYAKRRLTLSLHMLAFQFRVNKKYGLSSIKTARYPYLRVLFG